MPSYQHVLLAIDYSTQNRYVAEKARTIATLNHAKFSIVHVIEHVPSDNVRVMEDLLDAQQNTLTEIANDLGIEAHNQWLRAGIPAKEIVALAKEQAVDLIVMGTHQHHGFARLLGSPSSDTFHRTSCDLLSVHLN